MSVPETAGFYWAKRWETGPWTIVFVYTSLEWSGIWSADPDSGRCEDVAEWGPRVEPPDPEQHVWPTDGRQYLPETPYLPFRVETAPGLVTARFDSQSAAQWYARCHPWARIWRGVDAIGEYDNGEWVQPTQQTMEPAP